MTDRTALLVALLVVLVVLPGVLFLAWRLRGLAAMRKDAERRAVAAFEEMNRLTRELRERSADEPADAGIRPGERLLRRYPGTARNAVAGRPPLPPRSAAEHDESPSS